MWAWAPWGEISLGEGSVFWPLGSPVTVFFASQQYSPFQMDKLDCSPLGSWRVSPPAGTAAAPDQQLHSESNELLYAPSYSLPFSYRYGPFPLDSHVFSGKQPMLPAKFGQPQGAPCEVARFFLSALPAGGECQWHYANPLVPGSPSPAKGLSEPPMNTTRHSLVPSYEGGSVGCACGGGVGSQNRSLYFRNGPHASLVSTHEGICVPSSIHYTGMCA